MTPWENGHESIVKTSFKYQKNAVTIAPMKLMIQSHFSNAMYRKSFVSSQFIFWVGIY